MTPETRFFKAVRPDRTSHYDKKTLWKPGEVIEVSQEYAEAWSRRERPLRKVTPESVWMPGESCGPGIHGSPSILDAVHYQDGRRSVYCTFTPESVCLGRDNKKARFKAVRVGEFLTPGEADAESYGPDPWRPLLTLWYGGYIPSFDGRVWRLHAGPEAKAVLEWVPGKERGNE